MRVGFFCIQEVTGFSARLQLYLQAFPLVGHRFADLAGSLVAYRNWPSRSAMVRVLSLSDHVKRMVEQMPFS